MVAKACFVALRPETYSGFRDLTKEPRGQALADATGVPIQAFSNAVVAFYLSEYRTDILDPGIKTLAQRNARAAFSPGTKKGDTIILLGDEVIESFGWPERRGFIATRVAAGRKIIALPDHRDKEWETCLPEISGILSKIWDRRGHHDETRTGLGRTKRFGFNNYGGWYDAR